MKIKIDVGEGEFTIEWDGEESQHEISDLLTILATDYAAMIEKVSPELPPPGTRLN